MFDFFNLSYNVVDPDGDVEYRSKPFPFLSTHAHWVLHAAGIRLEIWEY